MVRQKSDTDIQTGMTMTANSYNRELTDQLIATDCRPLEDIGRLENSNIGSLLVKLISEEVALFSLVNVIGMYFSIL